MAVKPTPKTGIARVYAAFFYSLSGLGRAMREPAFFQEVLLVAGLSVLLACLPLALIWKGLLFFVTASTLVVELLNTALECVVDLASPDYHELAKAAKDLGSAAVLVSFLVAAVLWGLALLTLLRS